MYSSQTAQALASLSVLELGCHDAIAQPEGQEGKKVRELASLGEKPTHKIPSRSRGGIYPLGGISFALGLPWGEDVLYLDYKVLTTRRR